MTIQNPTQKAQPEPDWLHDSQTGGPPIAFQAERIGEIAELLDGEKQFCGWCGKEFPIYPLSEMAEHCIAEHGDDMTRQGIQTFELQRVSGMTQMLMMVVTSLFQMRVSLRRKAWLMGLAKEVKDPAAGPRIHVPGSGRVQ